ncbi:MAG: hypothetical protein R3E91_00655 [Chlamydiales bacterium]
MADLRIYNRSNIHQLNWPKNEDGYLGKNYLLPFILEGTDSFISNAKTTLYLLHLDDCIIPISVNETEYDNSYILSSYFLVTNLKEKIHNTYGWEKIRNKISIFLLDPLLKWIKINKVVIINNWLLTTNPYPDLTKKQIEILTNFLKKQFPDHYLMFRSLNIYKNTNVFEALQRANYRMIPTRNIYLYDPQQTEKLNSNIIRKQRRDISKISQSHYSIETPNVLSDKEVSRILELYHHLYISRYTKYSPLYTKKYLHHMLEKKILRFKLLKKEGEIYAVAGFLKKNGYLLTPFLGYDRSLPQKEGLYQMISGIIMEEIKKEQLIAHQGSGASDFKKWRGYIEQEEYIAIHDSHLSSYRRLFWFLGERFAPKF